MAGNAWEWCADSYAPGAYLLSSLDAAASLRVAATQSGCRENIGRINLQMFMVGASGRGFDSRTSILLARVNVAPASRSANPA